MAKILLVEDTIDSLDFYTVNLKMAGHVVCPCEDGECAIQVMRDALDEGTDFDLAMIDLAMPDKTGFEVVDEIRELGTKAAIVFVTANADPFTKSMAQEKGAEMFSKPLDGQQINQIVDLMLNNQKK